MEKLVGQLSKDMGIDKVNVLYMLLGDSNAKKFEQIASGQVKKEASISPANVRPKSERAGTNTATAAKMAYNNLQG